MARWVVKLNRFRLNWARCQRAHKVQTCTSKTLDFFLYEWSTIVITQCSVNVILWQFFWNEIKLFMMMFAPTVTVLCLLFIALWNKCSTNVALFMHLHSRFQFPPICCNAINEICLRETFSFERPSKSNELIHNSAQFIASHTHTHNIMSTVTFYHHIGYIVAL